MCVEEKKLVHHMPRNFGLYPGHCECYVMRLGALFKYFEKWFYFYFSKKSTWLGSNHMFQHIFCGCGSSVGGSSGLSMGARSRGQPLGWEGGQFLKSLIFCLGLDSCLPCATWEVRPGVDYTTLWRPFP